MLIDADSGFILVWLLISRLFFDWATELLFVIIAETTLTYSLLFCSSSC